ncbi:hypothetical protein [Pseudotenacibaculum haliotis]|uniref:Tail fiber protein n=1 Tax=Pseudotenacibaculum haliotis TaxID=1862138 RepID=A0ABW5LVA0_9FLAO
MNNVPKGAIMMWNGPLANIPKGWHICDGHHGTPDLRNQFIVAACADKTTVNGQTLGPYPYKQQGGADSITLGIANMPSGWPSIQDNGHIHTATTTGPVLKSQYVVGTGSKGTTGYASNEGGTAATFSTTVASHKTGVSIPNPGQGVAFDNRPAYYALYFIQKI